METVKCYVENERLVVEFEGQSRFVYIEGQTEDGVFRIRSEHFEKNQSLSNADRRAIRDAIRNKNIVID